MWGGHVMSLTEQARSAIVSGVKTVENRPFNQLSKGRYTGRVHEFVAHAQHLQRSRGAEGAALADMERLKAVAKAKKQSRKRKRSQASKLDNRAPPRR